MKLPWAFKPDPRKGCDLSWVPDFWKSLRPYLIARQEDEVLIIPPNLVYKTNRTGLALLDALDKGLRLERLPGMDETKLRDVERFSGHQGAVRGQGSPHRKNRLRFQLQPPAHPGEIALTYRCNNACRFCYAGCGSAGSCGSAAGPEGSTGRPASAGLPGATDSAMGKDSGEKEMSTQEVERIIDVFAFKAKIPFFSFTGGEPLLREDLEHLIEYALRRRLRVNLISNGTLISPERARALRRAGLTTAQISLESPGRKCTTGSAEPGALTRERWPHQGAPGGGDKGPDQFHLTALNRESLFAMPAFLASIAVERFSMNLYIPAARIDTAAGLLVPYSQVGAFVDSMRKAAAAAGGIFYWYSPTPLCIYNPIARGLGNKSCAAADGLIHVNPSGDVLPCSSYAGALGNLLVQDFEDVWFSARPGISSKNATPPRLAGPAFPLPPARPPVPYTGTMRAMENWNVRAGPAPPGSARHMLRRGRYRPGRSRRGLCGDDWGGDRAGGRRKPMRGVRWTMNSSAFR